MYAKQQSTKLIDQFGQFIVDVISAIKTYNALQTMYNFLKFNYYFLIFSFRCPPVGLLAPIHRLVVGPTHRK